MSEVATALRPHVLLVEDHAPSRRAMARMLAADGYEVSESGDGLDALDVLRGEAFDLVISDVAMPRVTGIELLRQIRASDLELPVILIAGALDADIHAEAARLGVADYLQKPIDMATLVAAVSRAISLGRLAGAKREAMDLLGSTLARAGDKAGLEQSLSRALDGMWMAFQPIVRTADGSLFGYEALMRSEEPSLPHPGAILDAAERLDRLDDVGRRVRGLTTESFERAHEDAQFFVNLHPSDLMDDTLFASDSPLMRYAHRVVLEITERSTLDRVTDVEKRIARLREAGFKIAVDDLGAGYAGLTSFALLEPNIAKIDMSLIRSVDSVPVKQKLVRSLVSVCRDLGVMVVAEGVETVGERDCLQDIGCDLLQGYLLARPARPFPTAVWPS